MISGTPSGFRDILPKEALARERISDVVRGCFSAHGYLPVETPLLEDRSALERGGRIKDSAFQLFDTDGTLHILINPEIIETSGEQTGGEGCLSLPGKSGMVTRPNYVKVRALDREMKPFELEGTELLARAICHECDHLDGHMYTEKVEGELWDNEYDDEEEEE